MYCRHWIADKESSFIMPKLFYFHVVNNKNVNWPLVVRFFISYGSINTTLILIN